MKSRSLSRQQPSRNDPDSSPHSPLRPKIKLDDTDYFLDELEYMVEDDFCQLVMEGKWEAVKYMCQMKSEFQKTNIKGRGTALHMAVNSGNDDAVKKLVGVILDHGDISALALKDKKGATPLHVAARRGFTNMCRIIIGENKEMSHLIEERNENDETPLFSAVLNGRKETFEYLRGVSPYDFNILITKKQDSILHGAIRREFFDLATFIICCYPGLSDMRNDDDVTPLEVLATKPSAFKSGMNLSWWKLILYNCISLDEKKLKSYLEKIDKSNDVSNEETEQNEVLIHLGPLFFRPPLLWKTDTKHDIL